MIRIVTDSASDITIDQAKAMDVDLVQMPVHFKEHAYDPEQDIDYRKFYALLKQSKQLPTTSQVPPDAYVAIFEQAKAAGDSVLVLCFSSKLSGTYQSAKLAQEMTNARDVHIIDTLTGIMGLRLLVEHAVWLRDTGKSAEDIAQVVTVLKDRVIVWGLIDTLVYLAKGGRMPKAMATIGKLLHIKPVVTLKEGLIVMASKARGYAAMVQHMLNGPAIDRHFPVYFGYTDKDDTCRKLAESACEQLKLDNIGFHPVGSVVGTHIGPGSIAVSYIAVEGED